MVTLREAVSETVPHRLKDRRAYCLVADSAVEALSKDEEFVKALKELLARASSIDDAGVRHGLIGLLKNLCLPRYFKDSLGQSILMALLGMDVWAAGSAMLGTVQGGAVVVVRLLCRNNCEYRTVKNKQTNEKRSLKRTR